MQLALRALFVRCLDLAKPDIDFFEASTEGVYGYRRRYQSQNGFTVRAYAGDNKTLHAFNFDNKQRAANLAVSIQAVSEPAMLYVEVSCFQSRCFP